MGGGNGAKAAQKRARNAAKAPGKGNTSQKKSNESAMNKKCSLCPRSLHTTAKEAMFRDHMAAYHDSRPIEDGFAEYLK